MRQYIDDFINTLTDRRQRRVGDILQEVLLNKENLTVLADKLKSEFTQFTPLTIPVVARNSIINGISHYSNMREFQFRLNQLFEVSRLVSNLIDTHASILTSEIKTIEDELNALEKLSSNYAFLLSDAKAYNFAYLEPFSDEYGREDQFNFTIPDRASLTFSPYEKASIRSDEGVLCLSSVIAGQPLNGTILDSNCMAYVKESTQLTQAFIEGSDTGWQLVIASPAPITNKLANYTNIAGAQVVLELNLSQPAPASELKLSPFADYAVVLAQAIIYPKDEDGRSIELLTEPISLDRPTTLHFPMQSVARIRIVLVQPIYNRVLKRPNQLENVSTTISNNDSRIIKVNDNRHGHQVITGGIKLHLPFIIEALRRINLQRIVRLFTTHPITTQSIETSIKSSSAALRTKISSNDFSISTSIPGNFQFERWGNQSLDRVLTQTQNKVNDLESWIDNSYDKEHLLNTAFSLIPDMSDIFRRLSISFNFNFFGSHSHRPHQPEPPRPITPLPPPVVVPPPVIGYEYEYMLGLYHIALGVGQVGLKGHFISKPFDVDGDIGQIKLKSSYVNFISSDEKLDSPQITSVEFSVSNEANPAVESDWVPILPIGENRIIAERFYPDLAGVGYFRFPADPKDYIAVYKNGMKLNVVSDNLLKSANGLTVIGAKIPFGQYNTQDYLTVDYRPYGDFNMISFEDKGFEQAPLVASFDNTGAGESFVVTTGLNEIVLQHTPYIDDSLVSGSTYSSAYGLSPYQPVVVKFADGTLAYNLTNYTGGDQESLPTSDNYYYIQSGQVIKFNQSVSKPFRVYYQHLENNARVRVVLRSNSRDFVSPKVDFFQVKAKTRRPTTQTM